MNLAKKIILSLLSLLPIQAIVFAADFDKQVDTETYEEVINLNDEFIRRYVGKFLPELYYKLLEAEGIENLADLLKPENSEIKRRAIKKFVQDWLDMKLMGSSSSSALPY